MDINQISPTQWIQLILLGYVLIIFCLITIMFSVLSISFKITEIMKDVIHIDEREVVPDYSNNNVETTELVSDVDIEKIDGTITPNHAKKYLNQSLKDLTHHWKVLVPILILVPFAVVIAMMILIK